MLEFIEENCLSQWVQEETRKTYILDLIFTNSMTIRGTEIIPNSSEISDHNTVISTFLTAEKTEDGEEPINNHKSDLPLYNLDEIGEEGWDEVNKILFNQSWEGVAEMKADVLQEMIMNRYVEAINQVAKKKVRKTGKKKTPVHLRKYIRMKTKATPSP